MPLQPRRDPLRLALRMALAASLLANLACPGATRMDWTDPGRESWQQPDKVVSELDIRPGERVADLGAGDGYFLPHLSAAVGPEGRVYAVDIEPEKVEAIREQYASEGSNVVPVLGTPDDPKLPDAGVDLVFLVNTYHHIEDRPAYFRSLRKNLSPIGRVVVIEPDAEQWGFFALWISSDHASRAAAVVAEMETAGYRHKRSVEFLPIQIYEIFVPQTENDRK